jgi:hypothetical protein
MQLNNLSQVVDIFQKYGSFETKVSTGYCIEDKMQPVFVVHDMKPDHMEEKHLELLEHFGAVWDKHLAQWFVK